jgi:riboflavin kinase/FMN adenylyltransferase
MKIYTDNTQIVKDSNTVVTIGTFDGVHLGHQKILRETAKKATEYGGRNFLITFHPHPRTVVSKNYKMKLLTTTEEKVKLLERYGIQNVYVINFTKEFAALSSEDFVREIICGKIGAKHLVIGYDHKFGKDRKGNEQLLQELGEKFDFDVSSVPPVEMDGEIISSTLIRRNLLAGKVQKANRMLGREYSIEGKVVKGSMRGRTLGFPTANIEIDSAEKLIPSNGVYVVKLKIREEIKFGMLNIGFRPTFGDGEELFIEVHIFDFDEEIYNFKLRIEFLEYLRPEIKFGNKEELIRQINKDKEEAINFISNLVN